MVNIPSYGRYLFGRTLLLSCVVGAHLNEPKESSKLFSSESVKMAASSDNKSAQNTNSNELLLYYHHHSFYAQKVMMALYEKKIPFSTKFVDITKGEQYESWYLKINPKGEVPVLKDGVKIIPDSVRIIDYLEDNFSNGEHPRLVPIDQGPEVRQKVEHFRREIEKFPANMVTVGSFFHPEFVSGARFPFVISSVQNHLMAAENKSSEMLRSYAEKNPESRDMLLQKAAAQDKKHAILINKEEYKKSLDSVNDLLDEIEKELASHEGKDDWWLCTDRFTTADISLTILLDRFSRIGLEKYYWSEGKRPNVEQYYIKVQGRDSYGKTVPTIMTDVALMLSSHSGLIIGLSVATALIAIVGGYIFFKRHTRAV